MNDSYTEAQSDAVRRVKEILGEHFAAFSLITLTDREDPNNAGEDGQFCCHHYDGGFSTVLGMIDRTHFGMRESINTPIE